MLNVNTIKNGLVIDHIRAGSGWEIYQWLGLDKAPFTSCLIQNVHSEKSGKNEKIVRKSNMELPSRVQGVFKCKNPRCITQTEHYVKPTFILTDKKKGVYRCEYCDTLYLAGSERR